jgi:hypothetical protein
MDETNRQKTSGGAATQARINFQNRAAAWVATRILCDLARTPIFGLTVVPLLLRCETEQPVDDLLVGSRTDCFAYAQNQALARKCRSLQEYGFDIEGSLKKPQA